MCGTIILAGNVQTEANLLSLFTYFLTTNRHVCALAIHDVSVQCIGESAVYDDVLPSDSFNAIFHPLIFF